MRLLPGATNCSTVERERKEGALNERHALCPFTTQQQGQKPPYDNATVTEYADGFQTAMREALLALPTAAQLPDSGVFSSSCFRHCTINSDAFWGIYVGSTNLKVRDLVVFVLCCVCAGCCCGAGVGEK